MGYIWQNYGIYEAKTIGYFIGYIWLKVWDILGKNYRIYYGIYCLKLVGYIWKIWNILVYWKYKVKDKGYIKQNNGIYRAKFIGYTMGYICQQLWDIFDKN